MMYSKQVIFCLLPQMPICRGRDKNGAVSLGLTTSGYLGAVVEAASTLLWKIFKLILRSKIESVWQFEVRNSSSQLICAKKTS